ncbi:histidine phosphatase superfamily (branch 2) domain-containing protein [Phthorimaea operculella]|nr:histidine phosphatase superfamily (branch 2) domain-containing protein [Phthorimaea operculella]
MILKVLFGFLIFGSINASLLEKPASRSNGDNFGCYWNNRCSYQLFGSKTPYDAIRGDLRDFQRPQGCEAVSFWSLHRHGNRNPGNSVTENMKFVAGLRDQIVAAYDEGRSQLCAQDIDSFRKFVWNATLEEATSELTGVGYEELYDIGTRVKTAYPELLSGTPDDYYFRPTDEQRTITSAIAFVHGLTDGTNMTLPIDGVREVEDVIRTYEKCDRYQELVKGAPEVTKEVEDFENSSDYQNIKAAVQQRLGIAYQLTEEDIYSFYESCRFYRSWDVTYRSPWCSVFTDEELVVLDYRDDVRHYYRNGYGSWVNVRLGAPPLKDLLESFEAAVQGQGKKVTSYFSHDTMMEMVWCALGLYKDEEPLRGAERRDDRLWRSSYMGAKSINLMAVLNRCEESGNQSYRVQLFIGEKPTELCPLEGCTWDRFLEIFQPFRSANLDFCSLDYSTTTEPGSDNGAAATYGLSWVLMAHLVVLFFRL